jgi:peptide/nickel transport system substrate-binding protein
VLHASASYVPDSLDIQTKRDGNILWEARLVFDSLVYLDASGKPAPWLAKAWSLSPDERTCTFTLREDVTFSDGTRFDAAAVKANGDRIKSLAWDSQLASAYLSPVDSIEIVSDFVVRFHLSAPYPDLLPYLAQSWFGLISPRQIRENPASIGTRPIGTGPFVITDNEPGKQITFKRRDDYHWAPETLHHSGPAYLESIVLEAIPNEKARAEALTTGKDGLTFEAPLLSVEQLRSLPNLTVSNRIRPGAPLRALTFNTHRFPFDDVAVRRAAAKALDRKKIADLIAPNEFLPKNDFLDLGTVGYAPEFSDVLGYDPAAASALLEADGWTQRNSEGIRVKNGKPLTGELLTTGTERTTPVSITEIQSELKQVGIDLKLTYVKSAELDARVASGNYDAISGGWWTSPSPDVLFFLYHSSQQSRQRHFGHDTAGIADPILDDLLIRARTTSAPATRTALYRDAQRRLVELVPTVSLHESHHVIAYDRQLRGVLFDTTHNTPILTATWLSPE